MNLTFRTLACLLLILAFTGSCNKPHYKACFTTSKDSFAVGEKVWFYNCSDFDGASQQNACQWQFENNQTQLIVSSGLDSISWTYSTPGIKNPSLSTGTKENADNASKTIVVY